MPLIYKTLFEVKLMHEYYCTNENGDVIFGLPVQSDRINFLNRQFAENEPSITDDIAFTFPEQLQTLYENYQLKLLSTYSGCRVVIRVNQQLLPDGTQVFSPVISLPADLNIYILLQRKNNLFNSYTSLPLSKPLTVHYFFSNDNILSNKNFPFLTSTISAFDSTRSYNQGELAATPAGIIQQYYQSSGTGTWVDVKGESFANENDDLLVPLRFYYSFDAADEITSADFVLKDRNGSTIKTISVNSALPVTRALVDFTDMENTISLPGTFLFTDVVYTLEVFTNSILKERRKLIFSNVLHNQQNAGVINIRPAVTNNLFNLFAGDGFLIKRKTPPGVWTEAPVFEIPVKSRFVFWRYINEKGKELDLTAALNPYLFKDGKVLTSRTPRATARLYFKLTKPDGTSPEYFPNPVAYDVKKDDTGRCCFDVRVPESGMFPII